MLTSRAARVVVGVLLGAGGCALVGAPGWAPGLELVGLAAAVGPWLEAWRAARGTALRPAVFWAGLAIGLGLLSLGTAWVEPPATGRPLTGHLVYLSVLCTCSALISVLNARTPGGVAWALLMALLVVVFLIPWLEGPGMARKAQGLNRLRLDAPWSVFYVLVVIAGITNYLPTRYGPAAAWLGLGLACEYVALTRSEVRLSHGARLWPVFPWTLAVAVWTARGLAGRRTPARSGLEATWLWFRDHWGVVWALRVQERFNRTAELLRWPIRLGWYGVVPAPGQVGDGSEATRVPEAAEPTLRGLLRRFAREERIAEACIAWSETCLRRERGG